MNPGLTLTVEENREVDYNDGVTLFGVTFSAENMKGETMSYTWTVGTKKGEPHILCGSNDLPLLATRVYSGA